MAGGADIRAGRAFVELFLKDSFTRDIGRALQNGRRQLQQFGQAMTALGTQLATAGVAVLTPLGLSAKRFAEFDDEMRQVKAVSQSTTDEFLRLTEVAKRLGATTSFTAVEVAGLMAELGRAGFNPKEIERMTGAVLDLARASKTDAVEASGIMAATIRQFGLDATDATRVADLLTATANKTFNSVTDIGEALKYAGPIAKEFGMSLEQTLAVIGGLGNVGIQGEMAGTAVRRLAILAQTEGAKIKSAFNVDVTDAAGNMRPMVDVLREIIQASQDMPSGERIKIFDDIFGKQGITGAAAIGRAALDIKKLEEELGNVNGIAKSTAQEMDAGLGGAARILMSSIEGVAIALGEALAPTLKTIADYVSQTSTAFIKFITANKEMFVTIAKVAAAATLAGGAFLAVGLGASFLATVIGGFLSAMAFAKAVLVGIATAAFAIASPIGIAAVAIVGATVAFFKFTDAGQRMWAGMKEYLGGMVAFVKEVFGGIAEAIKEGDLSRAGAILMAALNVAFQEGIATIKGYWIDFKFWLAQLFDDMGEGFANAWEKVTHQVAVEILGVRGLVDPTFDADAAIASLDKERKDSKKPKEGELSPYEQRKLDRETNRQDEQYQSRQGARDAREELDNLINPKAQKKFDPFTDPDYLPPEDRDKKKVPLLKGQGGKKPDEPITAATVFQTGAAFASAAKFSGGLGTKKEAGANIVEAIQDANKDQAKRDKELKDAVKDAVPKVGP